MFKFLKKKIKTWVEKTKETAEAEEPKTKKVKVKAEKEPLIKLPKQKRVKKIN